MLSSLFRFSRLAQFLRRRRMQRPLSQRGLFGLGDSIRIEALDRDAGRFSCQVEQLEPKKVLAVDVDLTGTVLTVSFDDQADDEVFLAITPAGYEVNGANSTSGTGPITKLVVTDAGTAKTSRFVLNEASVNLTGGLTIGSNVADAVISSAVKTAGGNVTIDSPNLTLAANISSGGGSQIYGGAVVLANDVTLLTGDGGANVPVRIEFQGTVDSDDSARTLNVRSEAIYARAAIGGTSELTSYLGETLGDDAEGGQSYRSVTTIGTQNYQAETSSGDVEFNGTYTTSDSDINLLGEGIYGVYLSLVGDTAIDVGAGSFNVVRAGGKGGSIFSDGGPFNLSIDAARVDAPIGIGVKPTGNFATPEINVLTFSSGATTKIGAPELVASGGIQATGAVVPLVNIELLSGSGAINLAGGLNNQSMAVTLGDANQTGDIFVKGIQASQLDIGAGAFDIELNGNFNQIGSPGSPITKFLNTGNLTLVGTASMFLGGVEAPNVANTFVAGCVATFDEDISLANVTILESLFTSFDTRSGGGSFLGEGGNITVSNLKNNTNKSVDFDIGKGTPNTIALSGTTESTGELIFRGVGSVNVSGDATLADAVRAKNLPTGEAGTTPSLAFAGNVTLTGAMEFEGITATFANGIEGAGNDLTIDFTQTTAVDGFANVANFTSKGATELNGVFTTSGYQWYRDSVDLLGDTNLVASTIKFDIGVTVDAGGNNVTLTPSDSVTLASGTLSDVNALTISGDLRVLGDLQAKTIDVQGNVTLLGDSLLRGDGSGTTVNLSLAQNATFTGLIGDGNSTYGLILSPDGSHGVYLDFGDDLGNGGGISIYDLSDPLLPVRLTQASGNTTITEGAAAKGRGAVWSADGSRLYIAGTANERVTVFDSSDPANLTRLGGVSNTTFPSQAFVPALANDTTLVVTSIPITNKNVAGGLTILDVSDPTNPTVSANATQVGVDSGTDGNNWVTTSADGDYAYYVGNTSMQIVDISDPANPSKVSSTNVFAAVGTPWTIAVSGGTAYVGGSSSDYTTGGYAAYDVSDPGNVSTTPLSSQLTAPVYGFALSPVGEELYIPVFGNVTTNTVTAWDVLVPELPQSRGQLPSNVAQVANPGQFNRVSVHPLGEALYVNMFGQFNNGKAGFAVFEIPTEPRPGGPGAVTIAGDIDGGFNLTLDAGAEGNVTITGDIGSNAPLAGLSVIGSGFDPAGDVSLTGDLAVSGLVTLASDSTISANAAVLSGGIEGACHSIVLNVAQFTLDAAGVPFSNVADLTITGDASLNGTIATTGNQSYGGDVALLGDTTLTSGAGAISVGTNLSQLGGVGTLSLGDVNQTGDVSLSGNGTLDGLVIGAGDFNVAIVAGEDLTFTINDSVDFLNNGTLSITAGFESGYVKFRDGLNATVVSQVNLSGSIGTENAAIELSHVVANNDNGYYIPLASLFTTQILSSSPGANITLQSFDANGGGLYAIAGSAGTTTLAEDSNLGIGVFALGDFVAQGNVTLGGEMVLGNATFAGAVTLTGSSQISANSGTFAKGIDGAGNDLTLEFTQAASVDGLANINNFTSLGGVELNGTFTTTGFQNYAGPITLLGDTSLNPTQLLIGGSVTGNGHNLTLSQTAGVLSLSGSTIAGVDQFVVTADSTIGGNIAAASVDFQGNVTLAGNATVVAAGTPGPISFGGTVDGGFDLSANGSTVTFSGAVGGTTSLGNLTTVGSTAAYVTAPITTTGSQTYNGQLVLENSVTVNASQFDALGGIDGGEGYSLAVTAGTSTLAGVSNVVDLLVTGSTSLNGSIATSGNQSYSGGVTLLGNATVTATNLSVGGVVDGDGNTLTVTPAAGQIGINGLAAVNLTQLTVTGNAAIAGTITTIGGNQAYQGNVTLAGATELGGTAATFARGIEGASNDLTLNFTQASVDGLANINNFTSLGGVELNGTFTTTGFQNYAGPITLLGDTSLNPTQLLIGGAVTGNNHNLTLSQTAGPITLSDAEISGVNLLDVVSDANLSGNLGAAIVTLQGNVTLIGDTVVETRAGGVGVVTFGGAVDGSHNLVVQPPVSWTVQTYFNGTVGGVTPLSNLAVRDVVLNGNVAVTGEQEYGGNVTLTNDVTLSGESVLFSTDTGHGVDGAEGNANLTVLASDLVRVGNVNRVGALSVSGNRATIQRTVQTTGSQTFAATENLALLGDVNLLSGAGDIVLGSEGSQPKLEGFGNLSIGDANQTGDVEIYGTGSVLGSLVVGNGSFDISIDTNQNLTFANPVDFLNNGSVSISTGAAESSFVSFPGGLNATAVSQVNLFGAVRTAGNAINLSKLVLNNGGGFPYALGALDTTNGGSAPVGAPITIESLNVSGGGFGFETGANNVLTLTGSSDLNGSIILGDGSIEATGDVVLGGSIQIAGDQNYSANVTLGKATTLTGNTATFANALEGAGNDLTINFTQTSTVDGFNNIHNFTSLGAVELNGSFSTTGAQNYAGPVTLVGDTTLVDQPSSQFAFDYENMSVNGTVAGIGDTDAVATSPDGRYAFVTAGSEGLKVIDISNPANGSVVACVSTTTPARDVVLSANGTYAFVTTQSKLEILDVSNVSGPSSVGNVTMKNAGGISLSADGKYVFVADGNLGGLKIVDVSNVASPIIKGSILTGGFFARDVVASLDGKYAYVAAQAGGLQIFDVSDPLSPSSVGSLVTDNLSTQANLAVGVTLAADSNYVFVAASGNGLLTVDVSNASAPQQIESFSTTGAADSSILSADGNFLYVTSVGGLRVVNLTDIGNQTTAGTLSLFGPRGLSLADDGEFVYVADRTNGLKSVQLGTYTPEAGLIRFGSEVSGNHTLTVGDANTTGEVEFGGNTAIASLVSAPGNFNVSLTGTNNTLGAANFQHTGVLGIGNDETDRTFVPGGITAPNVALSQLGGTFATNGSAITFNDISLLANATLDSTNNNLAPAGANVLVSGGLALNSYTLVTKTGTAATQAEGDVTIQNGTVKVGQGSLDIGVGNTSANVTFVQNTTITVAAGGQLNVGNGSSLTAGNNTLTLTTDVLNVSPTAGNITGSAVTITPVTPGNSIHAGNATGPGLLLPQSTINKIQTPVLTLGGAGYNGTIDVQGLTGAFDRLNLIANGTGGAIDLSGGLNLTSKGDDGVSLFIEGSGATTNLSGNVNLAGAAKIYDAVQLVGDASIVSTGGNVTITGGNTGIYSQLGNSYNLSIDAGIVVLGNQTGFGDNSGSDSFVGDLTVNATGTTFGNATQQINGTLTVTGTSLNLEGSVGAAGGINVAVTGTTTVVNNIDLTTTGGGIGILGNIAGPGSLNVTAASNVALGGTAGDTGSELAALTVFSANGSIAATGAATTGSQQFALGNQSQSVSINGSYTTDNSSLSFNVGNEAVLATGDVLLSTGSGNISVSGDLLATNAGSESLTVNSTGVATFGGAVGNDSSSATSFFSLFTTDAGGTAQFAGNVVSLGIVLNSDVELLGNVTFAGLGGAFNGSVDGGGFGVQLAFVETAVDGDRWSNLASLRFEGGGTINLSNTITTTGLQEYNGSVVLSDNTTLVAGADGVSLLGAVDGSTSGNQSLVINTTGVTNLAGNIGAITPLASLTTNVGGNTTIAGPSVITTGNQSYGDAVVLSGDVELRGQAGQFAAGVEGGGNDLTLNFTNATALDGNFVNITNLSSEGAVTLNGAIATLGSQTYNGTATLAGNTSLSGSTLSLASGVEGAGNSLDLNFTSTTALDGNFGNLTDLTSEGNVTLSGAIATSGSQTYNGTAALAGNTSLTGATLSLASGVEGAGNSLDLNFSSTTALDGSFANISDLTSEGDVTLNGAITTSGSQSYQANATLIGDSTLTGASGIFSGSVIGGGNDLTLNFASSTALDGSFSGIANLTSLGDVSVNGTISTTGSQNYAAAATVAGDTTLTAVGNVTFGGAVDGGYILSSNATGMTTFGGVVGGVTPLQGVGVDNATTLSANVTTSGATLFSGPTTLAGDVTMNAGASLTQFIGGVDGNFALSVGPAGSAYGVFGSMGESVPLQSFAFDGFEAVFYGNITAVGAVTVDGFSVLEADSVVTSTDNGTVRFSGTVEGNGSESLVVNTGGSTVFGGQVSNVTSLATDAGGTTTLSGNVTTLGDQSYGDQVLLANAVTLSGVNGSLVTVDGGEGNSLTLNFSDTATVGAGGLVSNLGSFESRGLTVLNGTVQSNGPQTYAGLRLAGATVLTAGPVGGVLVQGAVDGGSALTVNTAAATVFQSSIGSKTPLASLTTDAAGSVTLTGDVTTTGNQTYGETLNLAAAVVLTGDVGYFPGVQANGNDLTLNFSSGISLQNLNGVRDLLVEGDASLDGLIVATGSQNYAANVTLTNATTIQANVASVAGTITGNNNDLTLNIATTVTIDGDATLANLANLTVLGAADLDASIQTSGVQNFAGPVTLLGSTDLTGLSGLFTGGIAGNAKALTLNYSQTTTIDGTSVFNNIGDFSVVGDANLNAAIQTTGLQSYGGVTTLLGDTTLNTGGTGNVSFGSTVDGANRLDIEAGGGRIEFFGALGGTTPLPSLNLTSASAVTALSTFAINGTGAGSDGLLIGKSVSNVNIAQPGSTITNANLAGIRFAGGSQNSTVGGFTITGSGGSGVAVEPGDYTGSVFASSTLTGSGGDGLRARNTTGLTVRDTRSSGNAGSGLWFEGAETTGVVVSNNSLGIDAAGNAAQPNVNFGLMLYGVSGGEVANNTIGGNTRYGVVVETAAANVVVSDNLIGTNENGDSLGNGNDGILVKDATNVAVMGNRIANNEYYGIQVYNSQNVTVGGSIAAQQGNLFLNNRQYGIALRLDLTGTVVQGNYIDSGEEAGIYISSAQNVTVGSVSADLANEVTGYDHGIMAGGDCSGTIVVGNNIHDNVIDGVRLLEAQNLTVLRNAVRDNGLYGSLAVGDNTGTQLGGNTIDGHGTGVWVVDGYGLVIGSETGTDPAETVPGDSSLIGNVIANNTGNGIVIQINDANLPSINNTILSNSIYSNGIFGIQMYGPTELFVAPPSLSGATLDAGTGDVSVTGSVQGIEGETYRIQYFKSSANVTTSSRYAQGETLVAYQDVVINGGSASIDLLISSLANVIATDWITTTSTLLSGGAPSRTSAFSFGVRVTA